MKSILVLILSLPCAAALPLRVNETTICANQDCNNLGTMKYEKILPAQPGYQWNDAGGYCGSWAIQRATMTKGAWISQQQVRDHTSPGGGHDNEILSTNIEEALTNLKIDFEGFDYNQTRPQQNAYAKWLKKHLVAGNAVTWMILWSGQTYPIYDMTPPGGMYGHVEPVVGIQSNHPLTDPEVYDDDVAVHFTDGGTNTVHRVISTLGGKWNGPGTAANCGPKFSYCMASYAFGWAVKDLADDNTNSMPASLQVNPWKSEPDIRSGQSGTPLKGTLTATDLVVGSTYEIYRWDTVSDAFTYSDQFKKLSFQASNETFVYEDTASFDSSGTTYYRCVEAKEEAPLSSPSELHKCNSDADCSGICTYCQNGAGKTPPFVCHAPTGGCCLDDQDCDGSYCMNGPGHAQPWKCHGGQ